MAAEEHFGGFNKRRAEGRDGSAKPNTKTLPSKVKKQNASDGICYVQILGNGMDTEDTSPSILLFFDNQRFVFNIGEGFQRFCTEYRIKYSKIDHIFLSRVRSDTTAGLPGLLLTLVEEGISVDVWGPADLKYLVDAMRSYVGTSKFRFNVFGTIASNNGPDVSDHNKFSDPIVLVDDVFLKLSAVILQPSSPNSQLMLEESALGGSSKISLEDDNDKSSGPPSLFAQNSDDKVGVTVKAGDSSVIYIWELPEIKGKLDDKKAREVGLAPNDKRRRILKEGNSITLNDENKTMIHPHQVLGPPVAGPIVILVDCPTESHLKELLSTQSLRNYYARPAGIMRDSTKIVNCIIHLTPTSIVSTDNYRSWMDRFGAVQHIMVGPDMKNLKVPIFRSSARLRERLSYLCPKFFPAPDNQTFEHHMHCIPGHTSLNKRPVLKHCGSISAENLLKFHLRPIARIGVDRCDVPCLVTPSEIVNELLLEIPEIVDAALQVSKLMNEPVPTKKELGPAPDTNFLFEKPLLDEYGLPSCLDKIRREDTEIVLLGTGSSQPSKYRNVSSIYINLFAKGSVLLDCGEGTLGQLKRRFGGVGAGDAVKRLRFIWISHVHADHHSGLARILVLRRDLLKDVPHDPLLVVGPRQLLKFINAYQILEDLDVQYVDCNHTTEGWLNSSELNNDIKNHDSLKDNATLNNLKKVLKEASLEALVSIPVVHIPESFGLVLKAAERSNEVGKTIPGWKLVYSGDTRPCSELIKASSEATLLIHEATFEDDLARKAVYKNHCTTAEAIEVGNNAGVYRIILTHFSQRYPKIPIFDESHMHKTCVGFDLMSVNLADIHVLPKVLPYLRLLFRNEVIGDELDNDL